MGTRRSASKSDRLPPSRSASTPERRHGCGFQQVFAAGTRRRCAWAGRCGGDEFGAPSQSVTRQVLWNLRRTGMTLARGLGGFPRRRAGDVLTPIGGATAAVPARCIPRCEKTGDPGDAVAAAPEVGVVGRVPFVQTVTEVDRVDGPLQRRALGSARSFSVSHIRKSPTAPQYAPSHSIRLERQR